MDVITDVVKLAEWQPYPATLYIGALPSGGVAAITATATFGDVVICLLLVIVVGLQIAQAVHQWKR